MNSNTLSIKEARKLVLHSQKVLAQPAKGKAIEATLAAIEHLGYIQIDTISVIQRAHHHTLWSRNPRYALGHLDELIETGKVFEYWSHAAAYLPMSDFRFSLPNKIEIAKGRKLWYECDSKIKRHVLKRVTEEGLLQAKDFERKEKGKLATWEWKPAKTALEQLFMEGKLMVARRQGFQKVYDLTERILPGNIDTTPPTQSEWAKNVIIRYLNANGLGDANEISYLRKGKKPMIQTELENLMEEGQVMQVQVKDQTFYALPNSPELLKKPQSKSRLKILNPFDNFVIQRKRMKMLFDFDYQIECYVPALKRKHGYFCLPILWNGTLVARMDCKADRKTNTFIIQNLVLEPNLKNLDRFTVALTKEIGAFMNFNQCHKVVVKSVSDSYVKQLLKVSIS